MKCSKGIEDHIDRSEFWGRHIERWSSSGATQAEYCRRHKLKLSGFGYWKRRLAQERAPAEFVEVRLREDPAPIKGGGSIMKLLIARSL